MQKMGGRVIGEIDVMLANIGKLSVATRKSVFSDTRYIITNFVAFNEDSVVGPVFVDCLNRRWPEQNFVACGCHECICKRFYIVFTSIDFNIVFESESVWNGRMDLRPNDLAYVVFFTCNVNPKLRIPNTMVPPVPDIPAQSVPVIQPAPVGSSTIFSCCC